MAQNRVEMKTDLHGRPLQCLSPVPGASGSAGVTLTDASQAVAIPSGAQVIRVSCTCNAYIDFGLSGDSADANDILFPVGSEFFAVREGWTHVHAVRLSGEAGVFRITEMR